MKITFTRTLAALAVALALSSLSARAGEGAATTTNKTDSTTSTNKIKLKVIKVDSEETASEDGHGTNAVDGKTDTMWHTEWTDNNPATPHEIIIEMTPPSSIKGFTYLPRQDEEANGTIADYEFYISDDVKEFGKPVSKGTFKEGKDKKTVPFEAKKGKYIKLKALTEINGGPWTSAAEINVVPDDK